MPTAWPAKTVLKLIFFRPRQILPQLVGWHMVRKRSMLAGRVTGSRKKDVSKLPAAHLLPPRKKQAEVFGRSSKGGSSGVTPAPELDLFTIDKSLGNPCSIQLSYGPVSPL
jgi:hypothetical protein